MEKSYSGEETDVLKRALTPDQLRLIMKNSFDLPPDFLDDSGPPARLLPPKPPGGSDMVVPDEPRELLAA